jgi:hypothetical protein
MDEDVPAGMCMSESGPCETSDSGGVDTNAGLGDPCSASGQCESGICSATFDGEIGEFECHTTCIPDFDEARWCIDDASCCSGSVCSLRGYCQPNDATSTGGDASTSTGGADTSGDATGTTTGAGETGTWSGATTTGTTSGGATTTGTSA